MLDSVATLQFAWFLTGAQPPSSMQLFQDMFGREPDNFQKLQPPQAPFPLTVQGFVDGETEHKLQSHAGRVDYIISGVQVGPETPLLSVRPSELLTQALEKASRAAKAIGNINRAAVVLTFAEKLESSNDASEFFATLFDGAVDFKDTSDVHFQINRPIKGNGMPDMNRILKWTADVMHVQLVNFSGSTVLNEPSSATQLLQLNYSIDVNTVPSATIYGPHEHDSIFSQLSSAALDKMHLRNLREL